MIHTKILKLRTETIFITFSIVICRSLLLKLESLVTSLASSAKSFKEEIVILKGTNKQLTKTAEMAEIATKKLTIELHNAQKKENVTGSTLKTRESELGLVFTKAQCDRLWHHKKTRWDSNDYNNAVVLACVSSRAYCHVREKLQIPLPHITSVQRFLTKLHCGPGLMLPVLKLLEAQSHKLTKLECLVVGMFDEMCTSRIVCYYYKEDRVLGPFRNAQVVYIKGLFGNSWGCPVWYDFDTRITKEIINMIAEKVYLAGFTTVAYTSDLSPTNQGFHSDIGINLETQEFKHPTTGEKQFVFSDAPHGIKNTRNHLFDDGVVLNPSAPRKDHQVACKEPLEQLMSPTPGAELLPTALSWMHLEAREQDRQKVFIAAETINGKTADCLEDAGDRGIIRSLHYKVK